MNKEQALDALRRAAHRGRKRHLRVFVFLLGVLALGQFAWIVATGVTLAKVVSALLWVLLMGLFHVWWLATPAEHTYDPEHLKRTLSGGELVRGEVVKVGTDHRLTVRVGGEEGRPTDLVWTTVRQVRDLRGGDPLWLSPPARRGEHIVAIAARGRASVPPDDEPLVLWPLSAAWTTGPWD